MAEERRFIDAGELGDPILIVSEVCVEYKVKAQRNSGGKLARVFAQAVGKSETVQAVKNVSFVLHRGETIGLIGTNGAGKSSLIRVIAGLEKPKSGNVWAASQPSMLSVGGAFMKFLSGARNIKIGLLARGFTPAEVAEEYPKVVSTAELREFIHRPMDTYSSGMAARLKFAIAISKVPDILLIDEALSTGDARFLKKSNDLLAEIRSRAGAVIMVNHAASMIQANCSRVVWLDRGEVVADGPTREILPKYEEFLDKRNKRQGKAQ